MNVSKVFLFVFTISFSAYSDTYQFVLDPNFNSTMKPQLSNTKEVVEEVKVVTEEPKVAPQNELKEEPKVELKEEPKTESNKERKKREKRERKQRKALAKRERKEREALEQRERAARLAKERAERIERERLAAEKIRLEAERVAKIRTDRLAREQARVDTRDEQRRQRIIRARELKQLAENAEAKEKAEKEEKTKNVLNSLSTLSAPEHESMDQPGAINYEVTTVNFGHIPFDYKYDMRREEIIGFDITNKGSPRINPYAANFTGSQKSERTYKFEFQQRARQGINLEIFETANPSGRISHWFMHSAIYFFPRKILPAVEYIEAESILKVTLPTNEVVNFSSINKEIVSGVLQETAVMDNNTNRYNRQFAKINYSGNGVMVRIDQRGGTPESEFVFGTRLKKFATITYKGKTCKVSAPKLWNQDNAGNETAYLLYSSDEEFAQKILKDECGWLDFSF